MAEQHAAPDAPRRQFQRLKWITTIVPAVAVFLYETARHDLLTHVIPTEYGNLIVGLLMLVLAYGSSELLFGVVERLQAQAVARSQEVAALSAVVQERERLSRELHDGLAQLVAYLLVRLDTVSELVTTERRRDAIAELERLRGVADDLYADVQESITGLRAQVADRGLLPALQEYVEEFEERHGIVVNLRSEAPNGALETLPPLAGLQIFRIVQEALTNVRKHAGVERAWVSFKQPGPQSIHIVVGDDGRGFDPSSPELAERRSFGLATMRERAESLGGSLHVESEPGEGTRVLVVMPLRTAAAEAKNGALAPGAR